MSWEQLNSIEREHPGLVTGTESLIKALEQADANFGASMVDYRYVDRLLTLAEHLDSVGLLLARHRYASAFTILRTALEHTLVDTLLLNATRRRDQYLAASEEWEARQREQWAAGAEGTEDIESIERRGRDVIVVRAAYPLRDPEGTLVGRVSPYAVAMEHHSPFIGKKSDQADRWQHVSTVEDRREHAERNRIWWDTHLSWSAIKSHLELNGIYTERETRRLDVHYGFLSAFTHAHNDGYSIAHSGRPPAGGCHFCRELAVLYCATIAALEVRAAVEHCQRRNSTFACPCDDALDAADRGSAHLWFPGGRPSQWDRHREVLQRQFESGQWTQRVVAPEELSDDDITYYGEPMSRLVAIHSSSTEVVTGLAYQSPWPQPGPWTATHP